MYVHNYIVEGVMHIYIYARVLSLSARPRVIYRPIDLLPRSLYIYTHACPCMPMHKHKCIYVRVCIYR